MCFRSMSYALQLSQPRGEMKTSMSRLPSLKLAEPCVPPWSGGSVCPSATFLSAFKPPNRGGVFLKTPLGLNSNLALVSCCELPPEHLGCFGRGVRSAQMRVLSIVTLYYNRLKKFACLTPSQYNCLILTGSESKNMENGRDNNIMPSSSCWFSCDMKLKSVMPVFKSVKKKKKIFK